MTDTFIPNDHLPFLKETYERKIREVNDRIEPLLKEREYFEKLLNQVVSQLPSDNMPIGFLEDYNPAWSYSEKAHYILTEMDVDELSLQEIAARIAEYEPNVRMQDITNNLSVIFSNDANKPIPKFKRRKNDKGKYIYKL
jgi:hypothetical protein